MQNKTNSFTINKRLERKFQDGTQTTLQMTRTKKEQQIDIKHIEHVLESIKRKAKKENFNVKVMIRGLNADKWNTLKGFDTELDVDEFEEYYKDKVKDTDKFEKFSQLQVTILKTPIK
jgi:hypothetical protein